MSLLNNRKLAECTIMLVIKKLKQDCWWTPQNLVMATETRSVTSLELCEALCFSLLLTGDMAQLSPPRKTLILESGSHHLIKPLSLLGLKSHTHSTQYCTSNIFTPCWTIITYYAHKDYNYYNSSLLHKERDIIRELQIQSVLMPFMDECLPLIEPNRT